MKQKAECYLLSHIYVLPVKTVRWDFIKQPKALALYVHYAFLMQLEA